MSSGVLLAYLLYLGRLNNNIWVLVYMKNPSDQVNRAEKPELTGEVEMNSVDFTYPSRPVQKVLKGINFKIKSGETVAFVGSSGAGKSTIASLIQQFYTPSGGSIAIDGAPIENIEHEYYHEKVGDEFNFATDQCADVATHIVTTLAVIYRIQAYFWSKILHYIPPRNDQ
ncbi:hypothetical protein ANCDUO_00650 [Ancylostoma duodenale]|uniref:ABC transporter domain-containing protein n=1 Tax=Ancylostoma duodenale TaxID=51022 RepID=A0A0C2HBH8_9BILA|nr:hypothetical protein ANCDUO_00650 [Ancylostoma duodenale]